MIANVDKLTNKNETMCSFNFKLSDVTLLNQIANNSRANGWSQRINSLLNNSENPSQKADKNNLLLVNYLEDNNSDLSGYQMMKGKRAINWLQ